MKNTFTLIIAAAYILITQNASATSLQLEGPSDNKIVVRTQLPVNAEAEEIMREILAFNEVYKQAEISKKVAPESEALNNLEETMSEYIADLKKILPRVEESNNETERQQLLDGVYRSNNPFATFYM